MTSPREAEPVLHPAAEEPWFRALSRERQQQFHESSRDEASRHAEVERRARTRYARSATQVALLFGALDVFCPGGGAASALLAVAFGAGIGVAFERLDADRLLSGAVGLLAFFLLQWTTRTGLSAAHMFLFFPVGAICALQGLRRENGD